MGPCGAALCGQTCGRPGSSAGPQGQGQRHHQGESLNTDHCLSQGMGSLSLRSGRLEQGGCWSGLNGEVLVLTRVGWWVWVLGKGGKAMEGE